jgi:hypothetical protein
VHFHNANFKRYQIESSLTIHCKSNVDAFFVVKESATASITQYHDSSDALSIAGFNVQLSFEIQTDGETAVHLVASIQSQIADNLPMFAIFLIKLNVKSYLSSFSDFSSICIISLAFSNASIKFFHSTTIHHFGNEYFLTPSSIFTSTCCSISGVFFSLHPLHTIFFINKI